MKITAVSAGRQKFGRFHKVIKEFEKGVSETLYSGSKIVGVHSVGADGYVKGMRTFEDGSFVKYNSLMPKSKSLNLSVSGKIAGEIDKGLLRLKSAVIDENYVERNPEFMKSRKGIVDALKSHLQKIKNGLKNSEVIDITGKEV